MKVTKLKIPEVLLIEQDIFRDERGFFMETYHAKKYKDFGIRDSFVQNNISFSLKNVLRGLHAQLKNPQGKLIQVMMGEIFDVVVDIRKGSPTFGQWVSEKLSAQSNKQLYVPPGLLHGFCVLSEKSIVEYKCTSLYSPNDEI